MRLWRIHPRYLDAKGLVSVWREALLARKVLEGKTRGYRHHPQLLPFKAHPRPLAAINRYLYYLYQESLRRKYRFDKGKIVFPAVGRCPRLEVTSGQLSFEFAHLCTKCRVRTPAHYRRLRRISRILPHPFFRRVKGKETEMSKSGRRDTQRRGVWRKRSR